MLLVTGGTTVAACSSSPTISVTVSGPTAWASVSDVHCSLKSPVVTVTGTLTGRVKTPAHHGVVVTAILYDASGHQVGQGIWPPVSLSPGQSKPFRMPVSTQGDPVQCSVTLGDDTFTRLID